MVTINFQKKNLWFLLVFVIFLVGSVLAWISGDPSLNGHTGDEVFIYINGNSKSLQSAVDDGDFSGSFTGGGSYSGDVFLGQLGEEVIVNVAGSVKSFQEAINDGSLCVAVSGISPANFGTSIYGHSGDEIEVITAEVKDLQTAINDGDFYGCEEINFALSGTPVVNSLGGDTNTGGSISFFTSNPERINDGFTSEWQGISGFASNSQGFGGWVWGVYEAIIMFSSAEINRVEYVRYGYGPLGATEYERVYLYYNGQWNQIYSGGFYDGPMATNTISGSWTGVTGVKVEIRGEAGTVTTVNLHSYLYEIRAWGTA